MDEPPTEVHDRPRRYERFLGTLFFLSVNCISMIIINYTVEARAMLIRKKISWQLFPVNLLLFDLQPKN